MKTCKRCLTTKEEEAFDKIASSLDKKSYRAWCKQCSSEAATEKRVQKKYGVTPAQYSELLKSQSNLCAICKTPYAGSYPNSKTKRFAVDHNHQTGNVRGLLCSCCNTGLGQFKDNPELLMAAINYLAGYGSQNRN